MSKTTTPSGALDGITVIDFTTLLPGPLATLMLAKAGANVIKIERLSGDPMRHDIGVFELLNRGKQSIAIDLKQNADQLHKLLSRADILIEQFRPGVMERLGLGYEHVKAINPKIIYVSLNGYGADGPDAKRPGHDLTWQAESGLLSLNVDGDGNPVLPSAMIGDIAAGSQACMTNIVLALYLREKTEQGCVIQVPMFNGIMPFLVEPLAHAKEGQSIHAGYSPATGSSERYALYRTKDGRYLAVASPEEKFWRAFCERTGLPEDAKRETIAQRLAEKPGTDWIKRFEGADLCASLVLSVEEALASPRVQRLIEKDPLPLPLADEFTKTIPLAHAPELGSFTPSK